MSIQDSELGRRCGSVILPLAAGILAGAALVSLLRRPEQEWGKAGTKAVVDRLRRLVDLHEGGLISDAEAAEARARILEAL